MKIHLIIFFLLSNIVMGRPLHGNTSKMMMIQKQDQGNGSSYTSCWESLFEVQSCTGEMILFFLNGEIYLGTECCRAVRTIEHHCLPNLLGSLGYTSDERDVLYRYCDAVPPGDLEKTVPHH